MQPFSKDASDQTLQKQDPICSWKICVLSTGIGKSENSFPAFWIVGRTELQHIDTLLAAGDFTVLLGLQRTLI